MRKIALVQMLAAALVFSASLPLQVQAQAYPSKPIRIVVPFPPGGGTDVSARIVAASLQKKLDQSVLVENRAGANGNIGAEAVFRAAPDGYTLLFAAPGPLSISKVLYANLNFNPDTFVPISMIAAGPAVLVVIPKVPAETVQQLIAHARANPDVLNYASQGIGSVAHLTAETFKSMTGTKIVHVAYKGSAPAISDLLVGQVDMMFAELSTALAGIRSGKLRPLAVGSEKRTSLLPGVPALSEALPGFVAVNWQALVAPPGTPPAIAENLAAVIADLLKQPEVAGRLNDLSLETIGGTPAEMAAFLKVDRERWSKVIRSSGTTLD